MEGFEPNFSVSTYICIMTNNTERKSVNYTGIYEKISHKNLILYRYEIHKTAGAKLPQIYGTL